MLRRAWPSAIGAALVVVLGAAHAEAQTEKPKDNPPARTQRQREAQARAAAATAAAEDARQREEEVKRLRENEEAEARARASAALEEERQTFDGSRAKSDEARADNARIDEAIRVETEDRRSGFVALPNISYSPETAFVGGGYVNYFVHFGDPFITRPSTFELSLAASTKNQFVSDLRTSLWLLNNALHIRAQVGAETFPNAYFGVGKNTVLGQVEGFTSRDVTSEEAVMVRVLPHIYVGARAYFETRQIVDREPGRELASNTVTGASGGMVLQAGPSLTYDSRDNVFATSHGTFADVVYKAAVPGISQFGFGQFTAHAKQFFPIGKTVLALQLEAQLGHGNSPWYMLPAMGGDMLRGVFYGRFRDVNMIQGQAEWRFPIFGRWGAVLFMGAGTVARTWTDFNPRDLTPAGGTGLRYLLIKNERINIRVDAAYSPDGLLYYVNAGEAF